MMEVESELFFFNLVDAVLADLMTQNIDPALHREAIVGYVSARLLPEIRLAVRRWIELRDAVESVKYEQ